MPDPCTLRFYDFYEAHLAAHRLREEGYRAEVFDYTLTLASWPGGGFRIDVYDATDGDHEKAAEPLEPGALGQFVDGLLRLAAQIAVLYVPLAGFFMFLKIAESGALAIPMTIIDFLLWLASYLVLLLLCGVYSVCSYHGYRKEAHFWVAMTRVVGGLLLLSFAGIIMLAISIPLMLQAEQSDRPEDESP